MPAILAFFVVLGVVYALTTPVFEASDELWHYPMIRHLADGNPLPVQTFDPQQAGPWKQEASQPPLYYYLGAALTFWIDTSDVQSVRWLNPHADVGVITEDGNSNLVIHDPDKDPWQGTILAVRVVRVFSILLGAATVYLTYRIAKEVIPGRPEIYLGAAAINAFTPMFVFISGSVNNDNLVIPLVSLVILMMIRFVGRQNRTIGEKRFQLIIMGLLIGLGALTKITAIGLLMLSLPVLFLERWLNQRRQGSPRDLLRISIGTIEHLILVIVPFLMVAGWWYYRNIILYDDWSGWNAFIAVLGQRAAPASLSQLWDERWGFMMSYWGLFGGLNVPMHQVFYRILNGIAVIAAAGLLLYVGKVGMTWKRQIQAQVRSWWEVLEAALKLAVDRAALWVCFLWSAAVIIGLIRWATVTWSSQGRLVYSAISSLSTLFVIGLVGWMPRNYGKYTVIAVGLLLMLISTLAPFQWIRPAYLPGEVEEINDYSPVEIEFGNSFVLQGFHVDKKTIHPGGDIYVNLDWLVSGPIENDWSLFVHLVDPELGVPIAQRDMYPRQGLVATSLLEAGEEFRNLYHLQVPDTAVAPAELILSVGIYDFDTGVRLALADGATSLDLANIQLMAQPGSIPNPVDYNFENKLQLQGFSLDTRRLETGENLSLNLFWSPMRDLDTDFTFFAQLVDENTTRWASHDLAVSTSEWLSAELYELNLNLTVDEETPPGIYPLIIGVYTRPDDGSFDRLQIVTDEGRLTEDFLKITIIRIE